MTNDPPPPPDDAPVPDLPPGEPWPPQQPVPQGYPQQQYPPTYPGQPYPTQPYPTQPYPQQPYPQQYAPGRGSGINFPPPPYPLGAAQPPPFPTGAFGPTQQPAGGEPGSPKSRVPLFIALGTGVLVLALIVVAVITRGTNDGSAPAAVPTSATGAAAVKGYLEALASGDSAAAIAFAATPPLERSLLTDEMLAANLAVAPITDITTNEATGSDHQSVRAGYNLGETPVNTTFEVTRVNGTWLLDAVSVPIPLDLSTAEEVDLTINGTQLLNTSPAVFPGRYTVAASNGWYKLSGGTVQVDNTTVSGDVPAAKLSLSASGVSAIRKAAQAKLNSCLKKKSLTPAGCAFGVLLPGKNKVRTSTIDWQLVSGATAMRKLKPRLDEAADTASAKVSVKARVYCSSTNGQRWRGYSTIHHVYATLSEDKVQVTFDP